MQHNVNPTAFSDHAISSMRAQMEKAAALPVVAAVHSVDADPDSEDSDPVEPPKSKRAKRAVAKNRNDLELEEEDQTDKKLDLQALMDQVNDLSNRLKESDDAKKGIDDALSNDSKTTLIDRFANDNSLTRASVVKISSGLYTEIYETLQFSGFRNPSVQTGQSSSSGSQAVIVSSTKKLMIPQDFGDFSAPIGTLSQARQAFEITGFKMDRFYVDFIRDVAFHVLSPLGVFVLDRTIRQNAARERIGWWPIPGPILATATLLVLPHVQTSVYCAICGALSHTDAMCPLSDVISSGVAPKKFSGVTPLPLKNPSQAASKPVCRFFMRKNNGKCNPAPGKSCKMSHLCPVCRGNNQHTSSCSRK